MNFRRKEKSKKISPKNPHIWKCISQFFKTRPGKRERVTSSKIHDEGSFFSSSPRLTCLCAPDSESSTLSRKPRGQKVSREPFWKPRPPPSSLPTSAASRFWSDASEDPLCLEERKKTICYEGCYKGLQKTIKCRKTLSRTPRVRLHSDIWCLKSAFVV